MRDVYPRTLSEETPAMQVSFPLQKVKLMGVQVQLRESYSKGDDVFPDHHWLMVEYLDPYREDANVVATVGVSVKEGERYQFSGYEAFSADITLENTSPLSEIEVDQAQQAFFDTIEDIILNVTNDRPVTSLPVIERPELVIELPEVKIPELIIPELPIRELTPVEAFSVEDLVAFELNPLEPSEII